MNHTNYKILVVDDHPIVVDGIRNLLIQQTHTTCATATNVQELDRKLRSDTFDLCILDLEIPGRNYLALIRQLRRLYPEGKILIYTMHEESWVIAQLAMLHIDGAVSKHSSTAELITAVQFIQDGEKYFDACFTPLAEVYETSENAVTPKHTLLSKREKEVLDCLAKGLNTSEIARTLLLSINTVQTYRKRLMHKLDARNVAELIHKGEKHL